MRGRRPRHLREAGLQRLTRGVRSGAGYGRNQFSPEEAGRAVVEIFAATHSGRLHIERLRLQVQRARGNAERVTRTGCFVVVFLGLLYFMFNLVYSLADANMSRRGRPLERWCLPPAAT